MAGNILQCAEIKSLHQYNFSLTALLQITLILKFPQVSKFSSFLQLLSFLFIIQNWSHCFLFQSYQFYKLLENHSFLGMFLLLHNSQPFTLFFHGFSKACPYKAYFYLFIGNAHDALSKIFFFWLLPVKIAAGTQHTFSHTTDNMMAEKCPEMTRKSFWIYHYSVLELNEQQIVCSK